LYLTIVCGFIYIYTLRVRTKVARPC